MQTLDKLSPICRAYTLILSWPDPEEPPTPMESLPDSVVCSESAELPEANKPTKRYRSTTKGRSKGRVHLSEQGVNDGH